MESSSTHLDILTVAHKSKNTMSRTIEKYLSNYGDQVINIEIKNIPEFDYVVVIPAYNEGDDFLRNLLGINNIARASILIIVVVNGPENSCPKQNQILCEKVLALGAHREIALNLRLVSLGKCSLALCGPYFLPPEQGVGRARKMGADIALKLIAAGKIACSLIFSTDADAILPPDYCEAGQASTNHHTAALVFPFVHRRPDNQDLKQAIELYERRLNLYVEGLKIAGSPYAFHTIGSTIALHAESYAQVRGFPCRSAGEDFYVLNKLKKVGMIDTVDCSPLILSSRVSDRVPYGTGPALANLLKESFIQEARIFYNPQVFVLLKELLDHAQLLILNGSTDIITGLGSDTHEAFSSLRGSQRLAENLSFRKSPKDRLKAFHDWFDGFLTLKFIHNLRDQGLQMCSQSELKLD